MTRKHLLSLIHISSRSRSVVILKYEITTDLERLGDHAKNLMGYVREVALNEEALQELARLQELFKEAVGSLYRRDETIGNEYAHMEEIERQVDALTQEYQDEQLHRLKEHKCSAAQCVVSVSYTHLWALFSCDDAGSDLDVSSKRKRG